MRYLDNHPSILGLAILVKFKKSSELFERKSFNVEPRVSLLPAARPSLSNFLKKDVSFIFQLVVLLLQIEIHVYLFACFYVQILNLRFETFLQKWFAGLYPHMNYLLKILFTESIIQAYKLLKEMEICNSDV